MQTYPLSADLDTLQTFCDEYFLDEHGSLFEIIVAAPWVFMVVADYGKMASQSANVGWVSQREVAFGFPVALYKKDGKYSPAYFVDWALVYPFNYVDEPLSMSLGRQVYGWPKAGIEVTAARPNLAPDLRCLATVNLRSGPQRDVVGAASDEKFVEVFQRQPFMSGRPGAASYSSYMGTMGADYLSLISSGLDLLSGMGADWKKRPPRTIDDVAFKFSSLTSQFFTGSDYVRTFLKSGSKSMRARQTSAQAGNLKIITLKQFRDAETPANSCFRSVVVSTMGYSQPKDGALFASDPMSPDASGGILIRLYDCAVHTKDGTYKYDSSHDIVESLGLVEACPSEASGSGTMHTLQPVMPFWTRMDLTYDSADLEWSRTKYTDWTFDHRPRIKTEKGLSSHTTVKGTNDIPYKKIGSGAGEEIEGPLECADFGLEMYAINAKQVELQKLCNKYLHDSKDNLSLSLKDDNGQPAGSLQFIVVNPSEIPNLPSEVDGVVLLLVSSFEQLGGADRHDPAEKNLHDRVLTFAVAADCTYTAASGVVTKRRVLIPFYTFVEQDWDFLTEYEVYGRFAFKSDLQSPARNWIDDSKEKPTLLSAATTIFPAENKAQSAKILPIVQVLKQNPFIKHSLSAALDDEGEMWDGETVDFTPRMYRTLLQLPLPHSAGGANLVTIGLKQVRDAIQPKYASFQEIVSVRRNFLQNWNQDPNSLEDIRLRIYKYPNFDIFNTLQIQPLFGYPLKTIIGGTECHYYEVNTYRGARIYGQMKEGFSKEIPGGIGMCWSVEKGVWTLGPHAADALVP